MTPDYSAIAKFGVATMFEAAGRRGLIDIELRQVMPGSRAAGPARVVRCGQDDNLMVHAVIERIQPGDVLVLTMPEPRAVSLLGDLLAAQVLAHGAVAVLVDGAVRDIEELAAMKLPVWTRYVRVRTATKQIVGELDVPVTVGGETISPGDLVVLDADGGCVIPAAQVGGAEAAARTRVAQEEAVRPRYQAGELSYDLNNLRKIVESPRVPSA